MINEHGKFQAMLVGQHILKDAKNDNDWRHSLFEKLKAKYMNKEYYSYFKRMAGY